METRALLLAIFSLLFICASASAAVSVTSGTNVINVETSKYLVTLTNNTTDTYHGSVDNIQWKNYGAVNLAAAQYYDTLWLYRTSTSTIYLLGSITAPSSSTVVENNTVRAVIRFTYAAAYIDYYFYEDYYLYRFIDNGISATYDDGLAWRTRFDAPATAAENFGLAWVYGSKAGALQTNLTSTNQDTYDIAASTISWTSWYGSGASDLCIGAIQYAPAGAANLISSNQDLGDGSSDELSYSGWALDVNGKDTWVQINTGGKGNTNACGYNAYLLRANAPTFTGVQNYSAMTFNSEKYAYNVTTTGTQNIRFNVTGNAGWAGTTEQVFVRVDGVGSGQIPYVHDGTSWTKPIYSYSGTTMMFYVTTPKSGTAQVYITTLDYPQIIAVSPTNTTYFTSTIWANASVTDPQLVASCDYSLDAEPYSSLTALNTTYFYKSLTVSSGNHYITYRCYDNVGEVNTTTPVYFMSVLPPQITKESPLNQTYYSSSVWNNVTVTDPFPIANCTYSQDGDPGVLMSNDSASHFYKSVGGILTGQHYVTTTCTNTYLASNTTTATYFTIAEAPQITIESPTTGTYYVPDVWANVTATATLGIANCTYSLDGAGGVVMSNDTASHFYNSIDFSFDLGAHNVSFTCTDTNSESRSTANVSFTIEPPTYDCYNDTWTGFDYTGGDLIIDNDEITCRDTTMDVDGYIQAINGANLTLDGVQLNIAKEITSDTGATLVLNSSDISFKNFTNLGDYGVYVYPGATLIVDNTTIDTDTLYYYFEAMGNLTTPAVLMLRDSDISGVGWYWEGNYEEPGIFAQYANVTVLGGSYSSSDNQSMAAAITSSQTYYLLVDGATFDYQTTGIHITETDTSPYYLTIQNSRFTHIGSYGILFDNVANLTIVGNEFSGGGFNVATYGSSYATGMLNISSNYMHDSAAGVELSGYVSNANIYNNTILRMSYWGVYIYNDNYAAVYNNTIGDITQDGIRIFYSSYTNTSDNTIYGANNGVYIYPCMNYGGSCVRNDNIISNNRISDCARGINVDVPPGWRKGKLVNTTVTGNIITQTDAGIFTDDAPQDSTFANNYINDTGFGMEVYIEGGEVYNNTVENADTAYYLSYPIASPPDMHDNFDFNSGFRSLDLCSASTIGDNMTVYNHQSDDSRYSLTGYDVYTRGLTTVTNPPDTIGVNADVGFRVYECTNATTPSVTMDVTYDQAEFSQELNAKLYEWDGLGWLVVDGSFVDLVNNFVSGYSDAFSVFAPAEPLVYSCDNLFDGYCPGVYDCPLDPDCQITIVEAFTADIPLTYVNTTYTWTVTYLNDLGDPIQNATVYALVRFPNATVIQYDFAYIPSSGVYQLDFETATPGEYYIRVYGEHPIYDPGYYAVTRRAYTRGTAQMQIQDNGVYSSFVCTGTNTMTLLTEGLSCQYDDTECVDYHIEKEKYCEFGCDADIGCKSHSVIPGVTNSDQLAMFAWVALICLVISLIIMFVFPDLMLIGMVGTFIFGYLTYALMSAPLSYAGLAGILIAFFLAVRGAI